jgi:ATP-binding cassette subfamily C protein CydCD
MAGPIDPRLLRRASATRGFLVAGVAVGSATAILTLGQAWLLSRSVAGIFSSGALANLGWYAGMLALVFGGKAVLNWLHQWLAFRTAAAVKSQLRRDLIGARLDHPIDSPATTGGLITLVTQGLDALDGYFSKYLPQLALAVTVPVIIGVAILTSDWLSAVIVAVTVPLIPVFMALVGWTTEARTSRRWAIQTRLAHHFADLVTGLPTLQVFGRAKAQAEGLKRTEAAHVRETMATLRISFLSAMVLELLATLSVAVVAVTIGFRVVYGQLDLATALFVLILAPEAYLPIRQVGVHYHDSADGVAAAEAAFALIDGNAGTPDPGPEPSGTDPVGSPLPEPSGSVPVGSVEGSIPELVEGSRLASTGSPSTSSGPANDLAVAGDRPLLSVRGLTHTYPGTDAAALAPVGFDVAAGEMVAIAGGSGGGKTTLLNALLGFLTPSGGQVLVDGVPVTDWTAWRSRIAYVGQFPGLVNGDVAANVRLGTPDASDAEVRAALDAAGAPELALDHRIGDNAEGVSAGERRRIATARALLRIGVPPAPLLNTTDHRLLVLDEPTAGLDADAEAILLASLREAGVAVLVVSHRPAVLDAADRVITIEAPAATSAVQPPVPADVRPPGLGSMTRSVEPRDAASDAGASSLARGGSLLRRLLASQPRARWWLALATLLAFCATAASVALMGVSAWLLSFAALLVPVLFLEAPSVLVRFFGISRGAFRYVERLVGHDVALKLQSALRLETYGRLAGTTLLGRRRGDLLTRVIADVEAVQDLVVRVWIPFTASALVIGGTALALGFISPGSALVLLASAIVAGLLLPLLAQRASSRADADAVPLRGELADAVHEIAGAAPDIVAYGARDAYAGKLLAVDARLRASEARSTWVRGIASAAQVLAAGLAVVGALVIGADAVAHGTLGPGLASWMRNIVFLNIDIPPEHQIETTLLAVLVLTPLALHEALSTLIQAAQTRTRARAALRRVEAVLDAEPIGVGDVPAPAEPVADPGLSVVGLDAGWPGAVPVVTGLNLAVGKGERVAIAGPSGVGKTTVAATVLGLIPAVGGQVETRGRIGYLAQDAHIFTTTIAENLRIGKRDATQPEIDTALARAGLALPSDRMVGETGAKLSGGEARRVALARLLVGDYQVLILDEPTEHLDTLTATALMDDIWATTSEAAVLVISHDPAVLARCDRVVRLG